jgi:hypothetical protein
MASSQVSATVSGRGSGLKKQGDLDDLLMRLGIDEEEIDDLVFEDEAGGSTLCMVMNQWRLLSWRILTQVLSRTKRGLCKMHQILVLEQKGG